MDRTYTLFGQQNYTELLGSGPATIANSGCYLVSFTILANYYGHAIDPTALNTIFTQQNIYVNGDDLTDNALQVAYPDCLYERSIPYAGIPADLSQLQTYLTNPNTSVILEVNSNPEGPGATLETHFVVAVTCDGTNITIADPWTGHIVSGTPYGDWATTIQKYVVYSGTPTAPFVSVTSDTFTKLVTNSTSYDATCDALGLARNSGATAVTGAIAHLKLEISGDSATITTQNKTVTTLEGQVSTLTNQVTSLQQQLNTAQVQATDPDSGLTYSSLYIQSEASLTKAQALNATAQVTISSLRSQLSGQKPTTFIGKLASLFS